MLDNRTTPSDSFRTIRDIAEELQISERTVRRWIDAKKLIAHQFGNRWRVSPRDFDTFVRVHRLE